MSWRVAWLSVALALVVGLDLMPETSGQAHRQRHYPRARLPVWSQGEIDHVFFANAFEQALVGDRPTHFAESGSEAPVVRGDPNEAESTTGAATHGWSAIIRSETLEDEVKSMVRALGATLTTPAQFAGEYQLARRQFTELAVLFGVIHEYDGEVRWKRDAGAMRDRTARVASISKVGTIQVYNAAKACRQELNDLIRGSSLADNAFDGEATWGQIVDRSPIMQRLELGFNECIAKWTASESEFQKNKQPLAHQSEMLATLAHVLTRDEMDDSDDDDYAGYCARMATAAREIVDAVELNQYATAREAAGNISKACAECHELYRD